MDPLRATTWRVLVRWEDGYRAALAYRGPLWVGPASDGVHALALAEHARRRAADPLVPEWLAYDVLSFKDVG